MTPEALVQIVLFAIATLYTPGPNNIMLASSGARFGFRRTVPHLLGVALGFPLMLFPIALGLGELFERSPAFQDALRYVGAAVMLYIAWKIATAPRSEAAMQAGRPFTFLMAAGFQWINPKAWSMAIGIAAGYMAGRNPVLEATLCSAIFAGLGLGSAALWVLSGARIRRFLSSDMRLRIFNALMGALVAGCVVMLFID